MTSRIIEDLPPETVALVNDITARINALAPVGPRRPQHHAVTGQPYKVFRPAMAPVLGPSYTDEDRWAQLFPTAREAIEALWLVIVHEFNTVDRHYAVPMRGTGQVLISFANEFRLYWRDPVEVDVWEHNGEKRYRVQCRLLFSAHPVLPTLIPEAA